MKPTVGIIGLGLLGGAIADRLCPHFSVVGYDRHDEARVRCPGQAAASAREVAGCSRLLLSLPDSDAVESVLAEIEPFLTPGQVILDTTTGDPERTAVIGSRLQMRGIDYIDATVLGSSEQARRGEVLVMAGGRREAIESCADLLAAFARKSFHVGPSGSGSRMKLVVNLVLGLNRAVLAEGLNLARRSGLDAQAALEILREGAAYSRVMDTKGDKMLSGDFTPQARLSQHLKDVELILEQAGRVGAIAPLSAIHADLLRTVVEQGGGDLDNSAVIRAYS